MPIYLVIGLNLLAVVAGAAIGCFFRNISLNGCKTIL